MTIFVERTCTEIHNKRSRDEMQSASKPLKEFRDVEAYVLLGGPGLGKTSVFEREKKETGDGSYVTARNFLTFEDKPEWHNKTLFIDGLDEVRAGKADGRTPLDAIRNKLHRLGRPRFRLSCREADWFGDNDSRHLKDVSPDSKIRMIRLDPLPEREVGKILCINFDIKDPGEFIRSAKERGIGDLLNNPQTLGMLVEAVSPMPGQAFPRSRTETFELACGKLIEEHSDEHRQACGDPFGMEPFMEAAGRLCAVQLLSGIQGYGLAGAASHPYFPVLNQVAAEDGDKLRYIVGTKLFNDLSEGHFAPIHRQVAEFLAGRYLANLIHQGLSLRRVLALMTGFDGSIVTELRGLAAWLAAHSKPSRAEIIPRDPLGTMLYGDIRDWSADEKVLLLEHLKRKSQENPSFVREMGLDERCGEMATENMALEIRKRLENPARDDAWQSFVSIVVQMLRDGDPLPGIHQLLLDIARDGSRWPRIRRTAIDAFVQQKGDGQKTDSELKGLLAEVYEEKVRDPDDHLLGRLLGELYPQALSAPEVLKYLRVPKRPGDFVEYEYFWTYLVPKSSTCEQLAQLLDGLTEGYKKPGELKRSSRKPDFFLKRLPRIWLSRFLNNCSEEINRFRLFDWLGVAARVGDWEDDSGVVSDHARCIRSWLEHRPEVCKWLLEQGLKRCIELEECGDEIDFRNCMHMQKNRRLFGARMPEDYGRWCRDQALVTKDSNAQIWLMREVASCLQHRRYDEGISLDAVTKSLERHPGLKTAFDESSKQMHEFDEWNANFSKEQEKSCRQRQEKERQHLKPHETALRENRANPRWLHNLALVYLGGDGPIRGGNPRSRLYGLLGNDHDLVAAVLEGLRGAIDRADVPNEDEIFELNYKSQRHVLALPIVAGLEERASASPNQELCLEEKQMRVALAVHYTEPHWSVHLGGGRTADQKSLWFPPLLKSHPHIVSQVLTEFARAQLRSGAENVDGLYELAHFEDHRQVAGLVAVPLLEAFPVRCKVAQLQDLRHLLHAAALNLGDADALVDLIERKLANKSMNLGQSAYWLATGLLLLPDRFTGARDCYIAASQRPVANLQPFVAAALEMADGLSNLPEAPALKLLIRFVGATSKPDLSSWESKSGEDGIIRQRMEAGLGVRGFINQLASDHSEAATMALEELSSDDGLKEWRLELLDAVDRQKKARREGDFQHCSPEQALKTLNNLSPANSADLAALTVEYLLEISNRIRHGNTSDWRQYWNEVPRNGPYVPVHENVGRNALLSDLKEKLMHLGIDAQPEGQHADEMRSDIRVAYGGFSIPIEVKKSCSPDLWRAIKTQLIAKYTRDPGAEGYGIYLVFWFGNTEHFRPTPGSGTPPKSAAELQEQLLDTLSEEERRKISVCVIDVARPQT